MGDGGYRIGEVEEELKRYHLNQRVIKPWDIHLEVLLEKKVRELKNKNEEKSEEELRHYVDEYFEKYWCVSFDKFLENLEESEEISEWALKEVKRLKNKNEELKDQLDFSNNIINELEKEIINTIEETRNLQDYSKWYVEGYEEAISLTHSSHSGVMLETIKSTTIKRYEYLLNKLQELKGGIDEEII